MSQSNLLNGRLHFHLLLDRLLLPQGPVEAGPANAGQLTHALDTQAALQRHHFPDLVVDAVSPEPPRLWRRASTFCKAPLKKSTSIAFSANSPFNCWACLRYADSWVLGRADSSPGPITSSFICH